MQISLLLHCLDCVLYGSFTDLNVSQRNRHLLFLMYNCVIFRLVLLQFVVAKVSYIEHQRATICLLFFAISRKSSFLSAAGVQKQCFSVCSFMCQSTCRHRARPTCVYFQVCTCPNCEKTAGFVAQDTIYTHQEINNSQQCGTPSIKV